MNYKALDEALAYIEYKNSDEVVNEDTALWILAGIYAALFAAIAAIIGIGGAKYRKERKRIDEAIKDPKVQSILKKLVETMQKDIMKYPKFKNYAKFVTPISYSYNIINSSSLANSSYSDPKVDKVTVKFPFLEFDIEEIFKAAYGVDWYSYTEKYWDKQPDNCKPAPKLVKYVMNMITAAKSYVSENVNKKVKKCTGSIENDQYNEYNNSKNEDLDIFYDMYMAGHGDEKYTISLYLTFNKEDFVNKTVE